MNHWRTVWLSVVLCSLAACLPGRRDNVVPPQDSSTAADAEDDGAADTDQDTQGVEDDTAAPDAEGEVVQLPSGCTADGDCLALEYSACVEATCNAFNGLCEVKARKNGTPCTLGLACVDKTTCKGGVCAGDPVSCDDNNPCTADGCTEPDGCVHKPVSKPCDDSDPCTLADECTQSTCKGILRECTADVACREASCNPNTGDCVNDKFTPSDAPCDDKDPCTKGDACDGKGTCLGVKLTKADCDDGKPCTVDSCNKVMGGCVHIPVAGPGTCDDGDVCTTDGCKDGKCVVLATKNCDDDKPCTLDTCDKADGCKNETQASGPCDDGDACTEKEACAQGACKGDKVKCDDNNPCTDDTCAPKSGCSYTPNKASCGVGKVCADGKCGESP